jgi:hypothetical protein
VVEVVRNPRARMAMLAMFADHKQSFMKLKNNKIESDALWRERSRSGEDCGLLHVA